jgi:peptide/nickel transport system ATP-binding protein
MALSNESRLEVNHVTKIFQLRGGVFKKTKELVAVDDVSFSMPREPIILTFAGETGSGKTTISKLILGFSKPTSGEIIYNGKNIWKMSKEEWMRYRKDVQAVFQDPYAAFNPFYRVDHILKLSIRKFKLVNSKSEVEKIADEALDAVGLRSEEIAGKYVHQLSGGQRQRVMVARAFLLKPKIIVADEPVSMIDASMRASLLNIILNLKKEFGVSFLYITHDLSTAYSLSDRIAILYRGTIVEEGHIDAVIERPAHPYTISLIDSIPTPNPTDRWTQRINIAMDNGGEGDKHKGCIFYDRCPNALETCLQKRPGMIDIEKDHRVKCFR